MTTETNVTGYREHKVPIRMNQTRRNEASATKAKVDVCFTYLDQDRYTIRNRLEIWHPRYLDSSIWHCNWFSFFLLLPQVQLFAVTGL